MGRNLETKFFVHFRDRKLKKNRARFESMEFFLKQDGQDVMYSSARCKLPLLKFAA